MIQLETKRLFMRPIISEDAQGLYALNEDPQVLKYSGDIAFKDLRTCRSFYDKYDQYEKFKMGRFSTFLKWNNKFIGWCGLKYHNNGEVDLGYRFFRNYWGKGYGTESSLASLRYGFIDLALEEIISQAYKKNLGSIRIMEKIGMKHQKDFIYDGHPSVQYKITREDYDDFIFEG